MKISFIGLGVMGFNMAGHLANANLDIVAYNRTASKAIKWSNTFNKKSTSNFNEIIADIVILCVSKDEDVQNIVNEICPKMQKDTIIIDHSTISHTCAIKMSKLCEKYNVKFIDAPISGGEEGAKKGILTVMAGCDETTLKTISPILSHYAKNITAMGKVGDGQLTKMVNQICIAGLLQSLAEGMDFSERAGLNTEKVIEVISKGAAQSWQMQNRWETMLKDQYEHGFTVDWMRKDLAISLEEASENGSNLKIAELIDSFYSEIQDLGGGKWDTSSLFWFLQQK